MKISVNIINFNTQKLTQRCVESVFACTNLPLEVIVIDNNSDAFDSAPFVRCGATVLSNEKNLGFAGGANTGLRMAQGDLIILLNSDAVAENNMIDELYSQMHANKYVGIIGPHTVYPDGKHQISAGKFPTILNELMRYTPFYKWLPISTYLPKNIFTKEYFEEATEVDWVSGGCMAIRKTCMDEIGILDERYFFGVEDWDYCFRAKASGWRVLFDANVTLIHAHGGSVGGQRAAYKEEQEKLGLALFYQSHYKSPKVLLQLAKLWYGIRIKRAT